MTGDSFTLVDRTPFRVRLSVEHDAFVSIRSVDEHGTATHIFPHGKEQPGLVKAGHPRDVPAVESGELWLPDVSRRIGTLHLVVEDADARGPRSGLPPLTLVYRFRVIQSP